MDGTTHSFEVGLRAHTCTHPCLLGKTSVRLDGGHPTHAHTGGTQGWQSLSRKIKISGKDQHTLWHANELIGMLMRLHNELIVLIVMLMSRQKRAPLLWQLARCGKRLVILLMTQCGN